MKQPRALALAGAMVPAALGLVAAAGSGPARAQGNVADGRYAAQTCLGCHGVADYANVYPPTRSPSSVASTGNTSSRRSRPTVRANATMRPCRPRLDR